MGIAGRKFSYRGKIKGCSLLFPTWKEHTTEDRILGTSQLPQKFSLASVSREMSLNSLQK
jgi:hypothetical protein